MLARIRRAVNEKYAFRPMFMLVRRTFDGTVYNVNSRLVYIETLPTERFVAAGLVKRFQTPCAKKVWETGKRFPVTVSHRETIPCFH